MYGFFQLKKKKSLSKKYSAKKSKKDTLKRGKKEWLKKH